MGVPPFRDSDPSHILDSLPYCRRLICMVTTITNTIIFPRECLLAEKKDSKEWRGIWAA